MKKNLLLMTMAFSFFQMMSQTNPIWQRATIEKTAKLTRERPNLNDEGELYFTVDLSSLRQTLSAVNDKKTNLGVEVEFPNMNGEIEKFLVIENSNFEPELQARFPEIRAYKGKGITDKYATIHFSTSPQGVQTMLFRASTGMEFIEAYDKEKTAYVLFNSKNRNKNKLPFTCSTVDIPIAESLLETGQLHRASNDVSKTMRLAQSCTAEYANYFGATSLAQVGLVLTAYNNTLTRVNGVNEKDLAVHFNLIPTTTDVIYYDADSDPYSPGSSLGNWNEELMNNLHTTLGDSTFDIGHLFGATGGGGNAGCIGCVCTNVLSTGGGGGSNNSYKGAGITSPGNGGPPLGDTFDIDYVVHEFGHQLGGTHSFTFNFEGSIAQVEPESGSTIMGYAGITSFNVQNNSNALFCYKNILQIQSNLNTKTCPISTPMAGNSTPIVTGGGNFIVPKATPYVLTGTATDADPNDVLTYIWEQNNVGTSATTGASSRVSSNKTAGPNFRTFKANSFPYRYFPEMGKIIASTNGVTGLVITASNNSNWETLFNGTANRNFNFTFTARDNHIGVDYSQTATAAMVLTVDVSKGPLLVTSQAATGNVYTGGASVPVTWTVNSTDTMTGAATVDIFISTNASSALETINAAVNPTTWTMLASAVPNNGSANVTLPNPAATSTTCRFMVKASQNIFFAVNNRNFTINPNLSTASFGLDNFSIYPNPNNGVFTISFDSASANEIEIDVHDLRGRQIFNNSYKNTGLIEQNLELNSVQAGVYLVTVKDGNRKEVKKIIVE